MTPQPQKPRVLVVDDHAANRMAFRSVLETEYTVFLAESGEQALKLALQEEFAVILLDVRMPGLDGFETAKLIRQREQARYTPIIFTSAHDKTLADVTKGFVSGATDYLFSPVDPDFLRFKVRAYVELFLRNESLRLRVSHLNGLVHALQAQLREAQPDREALAAKIQELESVIEQLQRQLVEVPS